MKQIGRSKSNNKIFITGHFETHCVLIYKWVRDKNKKKIDPGTNYLVTSI